ncbi:MAG: efflux RND transporter periplasmic adaptor subunit [Planctomycetota bacterium]
MTASSRADQTSAPSPASTALPARRHLIVRIVAPLLVVMAVAVILAVSARDVFLPAHDVSVKPVIFDRLIDAGDATQIVRASTSSTVTVQAPGWLEADPFLTACTALTDGVVEEMLVLEGDYVEAGTVVARLVSEDAELDLTMAQATHESMVFDLEHADADLRAAQSDWDHPIERIRAVDTAQAALKEADAELTQLPALIDAAIADLERLDEERLRVQGALDAGAANDIQLVIAQKRVDAQRATVESLKAREGILSAKRDRLHADWVAAKANAELRIEERRALDRYTALRDRARAEVNRTLAAVNIAQLRLDRMVIRAPISGYVQRRLKAPGDKVMLDMDSEHSAHVLHMYDANRIQVRVDVPLADAALIRVGQRCEVIVDVLPDESFAGEVTRITHEADLQKNTLQVKVAIESPSPMLRPEMLTRVKFLGGSRDSSLRPATDEPSPQETVLVSPDSIVETDGATAHVMVIRQRRGERGIAHRLQLDLVNQVDGWMRVRGNLQPGELLATDAADLSDGARVRIRAHADEGAAM